MHFHAEIAPRKSHFTSAISALSQLGLFRNEVDCHTLLERQDINRLKAAEQSYVHRRLVYIHGVVCLYRPFAIVFINCLSSKVNCLTFDLVRYTLPIRNRM